MALSYQKLFTLMEDRMVTKTQLQKRIGASSATIAKLSKNEAVSLKVIEDICNVLNCQPGDIIEVVFDRVPNKLLLALREEKKMELKGGIYQQTQILFACHSNRLEGSTLTEEQVRYIREANTIGFEQDMPARIDDIMEAVNHFRDFDYMLEFIEEPLSEAIIRMCHSILKANTSDSAREWYRVGDYKKKPNMFGGQKTTPPAKVKQEIQQLLVGYNNKEKIAFEDIVDFYYRFEKIQPFQDGNGQVGRLLLFKECLKHDQMPALFWEEQKLDYFRGFKEYETSPDVLLDVCHAAQERYRELTEYFLDGEGN